jgi:hypothetical protein
MLMSDKLPGLSDPELTVLRGNAVRLQENGTPKQKQAADDLLPAIDAELAERKTRADAAKPAKAPRRTARKTTH